MKTINKLIRYLLAHWVEVILLTSIIGVHFYTSLSGAHYFPSRWFTRDDAYYYFKVAQNISEGYGSTFDGINLTNGYHPLWLLICVPIFSLARFDLILPLRVLMVVMGVLSAVTSVMIYHLLKRYLHPSIAGLIAMLWGFGKNVHEIVYQQGMETGITAFSIIGFLMITDTISRKEKLTRSDALKFGVWGLTLLLSRLDTMFLVAFGLLWVVFRGSRIQTRILVDIVLTYISVIFAFLIRVGLDLFLLAYDMTAIIFSAVFVVIFFLFNNLLGVYQKDPLPVLSELIRLVISIIGSAVLASGITYVLMFLSGSSFSISIPLIFIPIMAAFSTLFRLAFSDAGKRTGTAIDLKTSSRNLMTSLKNWVSDGLQAGWIIMLGFGGYALINKFIFGTFMPVSGQIKRWWGSSPDNVYGGSTKTIQQMFGFDLATLRDGWTFLNITVFNYAGKIVKWSKFNSETLKDLFGIKIFEKNPVYWSLFVAVLIILIALFYLNRKRNKHLIKNTGLYLLIAGSVFHILFYGATGYSSKHEWYWVSEDLAVFLGLGWVLQVVYDLLKKVPFRNWVSWGVTLWIGYSIFMGYQFELVSRMPMVDLPPETPYIDMAKIMEDHTPPGSLIGMTGGGNVGYFIQDRTIMNMDGLINSSEYFEMLQAHDAKDFYIEVGLDYIFANRYILTQTAPYSYQIDVTDLAQVEAAPTYGNKKLLIYTPNAE